MNFCWPDLFWDPMELRRYNYESASNSKYFGYLKLQICGRKSESEPEIRKSEIRGYPSRTRSAVILTSSPSSSKPELAAAAARAPTGAIRFRFSGSAAAVKMYKCGEGESREARYRFPR